MPIDGVKVGLTLGGGFFRGLAHIGVMQVLETEGIPIDMIVGCSMGSLVGGVYAAGTPLDMLEQLALNTTEDSVFDFVMPRRGLIKGEKLESFIKTITANKRFSDLKMPFALNTANLQTGEPVVFQTGDPQFLYYGIHASCAVPGVFLPVPYKEGEELVDGGMVGRLPLEICERMHPDVIIGVDVAYRGGGHKPANLIDIFSASVDMLQWQLIQVRGDEQKHIVLTPQVQHLNPMRLRNQAEFIEAGRVAARESLPEIWARIQQAGEGKAALSSHN